MRKRIKNEANETASKKGSTLTIEELERLERKHQMFIDYGVWDDIRTSLNGMVRSSDIQELLDKPVETDSQRIKRISRETRGMSIVDAFKYTYKDLDVDSSKFSSDVEELPQLTNVGNIVLLNISHIGPNNVTFDSINCKENFMTRVDLWKYDKFKEFLPTKPVKALVIEKNKQHVVVDILTPMVVDFINERIKKPWIQNKVDEDDIVTVCVKNLQIVKGGFVGNAVIPNISEWLGEEYTIPAFIPGSQLTLNASSDYDRWIGQDIQTFITSYDMSAGGAKLVCSRKAYIRHLGNLNLMRIFNLWCLSDKNWTNFGDVVREGIVTGVLNSSKKCGVFVEYSDELITGMISMPAYELTKYIQDMQIDFKFKGFEEDVFYDKTTGQAYHNPPFEIVDGSIKRVNVKPIFELA